MLLFAALRALVGGAAAAWAAAVYVLGTPVLTILGQALWQHTGAALGFSLALYGMYGVSERRWGSALAGAGLGIAVACRPVDVILAAGVFVALCVRDRRAALWAIVPGAVPLLLTALYQRAVFGSPFATGYGSEVSQFLPLSAASFFGVLVSPGRGLFLHAPILVLALVALLRRDLATRLLAAAFAAYVVVMAKWWCWDGAFSTGGRMLSDTLPLLGVGLGLWMEGARTWRLTRALSAASIAMFALMAYVYPPPLTKELVMGIPDGAWDVRTYPPIAYAKGLAVKSQDVVH
jgi:hypothetical protein